MHSHSYQWTTLCSKINGSSQLIWFGLTPSKTRWVGPFGLGLSSKKVSIVFFRIRLGWNRFLQYSARYTNILLHSNSYSIFIIHNPKKTESFPWKLIYRRNVRFIRILFEHKRNLFSFRLHKGAFLCNLVEFKKKIVFSQNIKNLV